ncbi:MAG: LptF/LptG family permease [Nitrospirota bacterium]
MKVIHKSVIKELVATFILCLVALNFVLMMEKLLRLSRFLSGMGTSIVDMVRIILYLQPQLLPLTIPMALLLSTLLVYGRLHLDNEIVILRNCGVNFLGISLPVAHLGALCFLFNIACSFYIGPQSSIKLREEIARIIKVRTPLAIEEGTFNSSFKNATIFVKEKDPDGDLRKIFIYDDQNKDEPRVLMAREGEIHVEEDFHINLCLKDGYINVVQGSTMTEVFFSKYNMILGLESDTPSKKNAELTPFELMEKIDKNNRYKASVTYLELHRRLSLPFLCIILIFFGPPLAMMAGRSGRLGGLTLGLAVFTIYYMLLIYGENLVKANKIEHYVGAWTPSLLMGVVTFFMFRKEYLK